MPLILNCLVQFSVILIALAALPTAIAKAGDECSFEKTVLSPAAKNPCFQKLVEKAMDPEDRKWLMYLSRSWNPDPSLKVAMVPGGIVVFKKDKKILDARWIYANPLVLVWNEKVIISAGELKTKSVFKFLNEFIDQPSSHATNFTLFPEAFAKEPSDDEVVKDLFTLYTFNYSDKLDAESLIREFKKQDGLFPQMTSLQRHWFGRDLNCTSFGGMESVTYDLNQESWMHNAVTVQRHSKPVVIKANSPTSMTIKGIFGANGEKTVLAEYQPLPKMSDSKERVYDAQHWGGRGETVAPEGKSVPIWKFKYFVCEDDSCQTKQEVENYDKLEKLARTDLRSAVPLDLERAMLGTSALTSCCQSKSCRKVAKDNISINLKGPGEGESAK